MRTTTHPFLSNYLMHPGRSVRIVRRPNLRRWLIRAQLLFGRNSSRTSNITLIIAAWIDFVMCVNFLKMPTQSSQFLNRDLPLRDLISGQNALAASPKPAPTLPGGPTGYQLQPIALAPYRTYPNTYAWGNCTWYVAGRRQVPPRWGDAYRWYYSALASGWRVGTIPAVGSIAWTPAGRLGHVALVEDISNDRRSVFISEMNYQGLGVRSTRWVAITDFKYIY